VSTRTKIAWTDVTDNIIVADGGGWWCHKISEGCANCYAASLNQVEFYGGNKLPYTGRPPKLRLRTDLIDGWERQKHPKMHFVASMTDVFGDWVPWDWACNFLRGMWRAKKQVFQVLTKRPEIALDYIQRWLDFDGLLEVPSNIWVGVSAENQQRANQRIPVLRKIPAIRFISVEPMLGLVDLCRACPQSVDATRQMDGIHWVIFGGESGKNARRCNLSWIRAGLKQCQGAGVPAFVKQLGTNAHYRDGEDESETRIALNHPKGGDPTEWPADVVVQQFPL